MPSKMGILQISKLFIFEAYSKNMVQTSASLNIGGNTSVPAINRYFYSLLGPLLVYFWSSPIYHKFCLYWVWFLLVLSYHLGHIGLVVSPSVGARWLWRWESSTNGPLCPHWLSRATWTCPCPHQCLGSRSIKAAELDCCSDCIQSLRQRNLERYDEQKL